MKTTIKRSCFTLLLAACTLGLQAAEDNDTITHENFGQKLLKPVKWIIHNWSDFDMMNVTFRPKNESPWELQDEFYHAARHFYDFRSCKVIGGLFGREYGLRRFGLAILARLGTFGAHTASKVTKNSVYYRIRHWTSA